MDVVHQGPEDDVLAETLDDEGDVFLGVFAFNLFELLVNGGVLGLDFDTNIFADSSAMFVPGVLLLDCVELEVLE